MIDLHDFYLLSSNHFYTYFCNKSLRKKKSLTLKKFHFWRLLSINHHIFNSISHLLLSTIGLGVRLGGQVLNKCANRAGSIPSYDNFSFFQKESNSMWLNFTEAKSNDNVQSKEKLVWLRNGHTDSVDNIWPRQRCI